MAFLDSFVFFFVFFFLGGGRFFCFQGFRFRFCLFWIHLIYLVCLRCVCVFFFLTLIVNMECVIFHVFVGFAFFVRVSA